jgi:dTDP-4-dehydrorhamnose 3,5-epimerase
MKIISTALSEVKILEPKVFGDDRGFFLESYNQKVIADTLQVHTPFVQDNHSHSVQNTLRGLHYQLNNPQGKLVRVVTGEVFDVAVDMRKSSPTFGKWVGVILSAKNKQMLWIPPGFAHGFLVLSPTADFLYNTTDFYDSQSEHCLRWDDPDVAIAWPITSPPLLSAKDLQGKSLQQSPGFT